MCPLPSVLKLPSISWCLLSTLISHPHSLFDYSSVWLYISPNLTFDLALALPSFLQFTCSLLNLQLHSFFPSCFLPLPLLLCCSLQPSPSVPTLLLSVSFHVPIALSLPPRSPNSTMLVRYMVEKARSSESLHCPTSRLGPRIFWWPQMWQVVVLTSKMCLWWSTMIWPKILKVSAGKAASVWVKGDPCLFPLEVGALR